MSESKSLSFRLPQMGSPKLTRPSGKACSLTSPKVKGAGLGRMAVDLVGVAVLVEIQASAA